MDGPLKKKFYAFLECPQNYQYKLDSAGSTSAKELQNLEPSGHSLKPLGILMS